jgi:hypothetical protein
VLWPDPYLFVALSQGGGQQIAVSRLKGASRKRHLALVMPDRLGAFGEHQVVIRGILEQGQEHSSLPTGGIRGDYDRDTLG